MKRIALAALAALALISCNSTATEAAAAHAARPAMWKVADADTTIYLFGTIHALPAGTKWRTPAFEKATASSDELVLEVATLKDTARLAQAFAALASSPGLPPILDRVPANKRDALIKVLAKANLPIAAADKLETWAVALTLVSASLERIGIVRAEGVESTTQTLFTDKNKPIAGLETTEQQFGYFDHLSEDAQRELLNSTMEDDSVGKAEYKRMVSSWSAGDVNKIAASFDDELKSSPELTEVLLRKRNTTWAAWVKRRLDKPGTIFVAVGAGHLAGPGSVVALLGNLGVPVTRVQ